MTDDDRTPWQIDRDRAEKTGKWPGSWGPFHRHFANDAIHRDGGPECDQPGTPRRVYVFDSDALAEHEAIVARWAAEQAQLAIGSTPAVAATMIGPETMDCRNCGEPIRSTAHLEGIVRPHQPEMMGGGQGLPLRRTVVIWSHIATGHERCEGRTTVAEPTP